MYRFLRTPRWIAFTIGIVALMVTMLFLARWQWHRYEFKRDRRDAVEALAKQPPVAVETLLNSAQSPSDAAKSQWHEVTATGTYDGAHQILIRDRSLNSVPGLHGVTPLRLDSGQIVLVNRGFIPLAARATPPLAPSARVVIGGRLHATQTRGFLGPQSRTSNPNEFARVDIPVIEAAKSLHVLGAYIELQTQQPPLAATDPHVVDPPNVDLGPHLSYTGQWIIFTICAGVGWVIVVRRTARKNSTPRTTSARGKSGADDSGLVLQDGGDDWSPHTM